MERIYLFLDFCRQSLLSALKIPAPRFPLPAPRSRASHIQLEAAADDDASGGGLGAGAEVHDDAVHFVLPRRVHALHRLGGEERHTVMMRRILRQCRSMEGLSVNVERLSPT